MFKVGDAVAWRPDGREPDDSRHTLRGTVLAFVPAGVSPYRIAERLTGELSLYPLISGGGGERSHGSFLVGVPSPSGRGKVRVHWPRVKWLRAAEAAKGGPR